MENEEELHRSETVNEKLHQAIGGYPRGILAREADAARAGLAGVSGTKGSITLNGSRFFRLVHP